MSFTTIKFVVFFVAIFVGYYSVPKKVQPYVLLIASYAFYMMAAPIFIVYLLLTTALTYGGAIWIHANLLRQKEWIQTNGKSVAREEKVKFKQKEQARRKSVLVGVIVLVLGLLGLFKYGDFFLRNASWLMGVFGCAHEFSALNLILPLGLSFYVFQSLGYCIDVYREEVPAERNPLRYALFVSYFPQVLQGPIGNYGRLMPQLVASRAFDSCLAAAGLQRIIWGFFKKLVVANHIAEYCDPIWSGMSGCSGFLAWFAISILYGIQLYADFSGYMDIACGCSQMLGIRLEENFDSPYLSKDISEFWRRWHMTLGAWFKNYLFYPILRSEWNAKLRKKASGEAATVVGLVIVWALIGLWHGANWSYVAYGLYHGAFVILAVVLARPYERLRTFVVKILGERCWFVLQIVRTFLIVSFGYLIFKPADLGASLQIARSMCADVGLSSLSALLVAHPLGWPIVAAGAAVLCLVDIVHYRRGSEFIRPALRALPTFIRWIFYILAIQSILLFGLFGASYQNFEYFKF